MSAYGSVYGFGVSVEPPVAVLGDRDKSLVATLPLHPGFEFLRPLAPGRDGESQIGECFSCMA
jgi:hypothetical protein